MLSHNTLIQAYLTVLGPWDYRRDPRAWPPRRLPGTEAATLVTTLTRMIARCGHFLLSAAAPGSAPARASEAAAPLPGLGDQALRNGRVPTTAPGLLQAHDRVVIRSDRTLIWIDDQSMTAEAVGKGDDQLTLRLARDAWRHFCAS